MESVPALHTRMTTIFHPTDLSRASELAFVHALKLTLLSNGKLEVMHVADKGESVSWGALPGVRDTLIKWKLIPEGSSRDAVATLNIGVRKVIAKGDPVNASTAYLQDHPADIVVLATSQNQGRMSWLNTSISAPIARSASDSVTMFFPHDTDGFVSPQDGSVSLQHVLIPVATKPHPSSTIGAISRLLEALHLFEQVKVTLLYIGNESEAPAATLPDNDLWHWRIVPADKGIAHSIIEITRDLEVDLVAMTTVGRDGFLDALRGSTTEQVMRGVNCPLIAIPAGTG